VPIFRRVRVGRECLVGDGEFIGRHALPIADNLLKRQFDPGKANAARVSDITYLRTGSGWLYLAAVMDLFSRKIVGWAMAPHSPAERVCTDLQMAITQRQPCRSLPRRDRLHRRLLQQRPSALETRLLAAECL